MLNFFALLFDFSDHPASRYITRDTISSYWEETSFSDNPHKRPKRKVETQNPSTLDA